MNDYSAWCRTLWEGLREGDVWVVPRSGLVLQKQDSKFLLIAAMPWEEEMPVSENELQPQQRGDLRAIRREFRKIGVKVVLAPDFHWPGSEE